MLVSSHAAEATDFVYFATTVEEKAARKATNRAVNITIEK